MVLPLGTPQVCFSAQTCKTSALGKHHLCGFRLVVHIRQRHYKGLWSIYCLSVVLGQRMGRGSFCKPRVRSGAGEAACPQPTRVVCAGSRAPEPTPWTGRMHSPAPPPASHSCSWECCSSAYLRFWKLQWELKKDFIWSERKNVLVAQRQKHHKNA